jgi:hypothetical protein
VDIEKTMEFILEQLANVSSQLAHVADLQVRTDRRLDRAIRLAVQEARQERKRRQELDERLSKAGTEADEKITQLAAAQLVTEEKLQRLIDAQRGANGKG